MPINKTYVQTSKFKPNSRNTKKKKSMILKTHSNFTNYSLLPKYEKKKKITQSIMYPPHINFHRPKSSFRVVSKRDLQLPRAQSSANGMIMPLQNADGWTGWIHEVEIEVRDYELDQFGVVNNSVYAQYCEHARLQVLTVKGCTSANSIAGSGGSIALTEMKLKFIAPLRSGDKCLVKIRVAESSAARVLVDHYIVKLPNQEPILKARATVVFLNKNHRPIRIPSDVISNIIRPIHHGDFD